MIALPYGHEFLCLDISDAVVLRSEIDSQCERVSGDVLVRQAMEKPWNSQPLWKLAEGKKTCTLIISDHTRPVPSKDILPAMLEELRRGNPKLEITLLVATGCHRGTTREELEAKLGSEIMSRETVVVHDCADPDANVEIGVLPSGAPLVIDRLAAQTDLLVAEGFIEPHFFAGFSGGRKSVLPGVCDRVTVLGNHCGAFIAHPQVRTGVLDGNPINRDMEAAAEMANLQYVVNVVIDSEKKTVAAFAGHPVEAHRAGCAFLAERCQVSVKPADIVITTNGGTPLDQNIYQCVKAMTAAEAAAKDGGVIILAAECADGVGGEFFYRSLRDCENPKALYESYSNTPQEETIPDQWQSQILARVLMHHTVIFVTRPELQKTVEEMKMQYAPDLKTAMQMARALAPSNPDITVLPDGVSIIVMPK